MDSKIGSLENYPDTSYFRRYVKETLLYGIEIPITEVNGCIIGNVEIRQAAKGDTFFLYRYNHMALRF